MHVDATASTLRLEGDLDGLAARRLETLLVGLPAGARIRIDLTGIGRFYDFGVAVLASALERCRAAVELLGLQARRVRELASLGVNTAPMERALVPARVRR